MKILIVADTVDPMLYDHFRRDRFPDIELILSAGDLPAWYLSYLMSVFNAPLYYVRGNHDYDYEREPPEGGESIDGRIVKLKNNMRIIGFEGSMFYHSPRAVQRTEREMWWQWQRKRFKLMLTKGVDIILTHAPPYGIHDAKDLCHKGFLTFSKMIKKYEPRYFIHGHTHLNYGLKQNRIDVVNNTTVINGYGYHILDTDDKTLNA